jgi:multicomponent Na+:H+ antiporter subunit D
VIAHATPLADWVIVAPVLLGILGAALLQIVRRRLRMQFWSCLAVLFAILVCDAVLFERVLGAGPLAMTMGKWLPPFGIAFAVDVMGAGFAAVAAFVAFAVVLHLGTTAPESAVRDGVYPLVLLLVAGVSGALLTGDLFNLYVWFEVMLIASFGLVVLAGHPLQLDAAVKYAVPNVIATTLFLLALGLIYGTLGTLNMADIMERAPRADPGLVAAIAALFLLAFGIKAAVFPLNAWLIASYHAPPAPISALIGGLLTKVGVYAALRLILMLLPGARADLSTAITIAAVATAIVGPLSALGETNLRRAIGFLLVGGIGTILLCVPAPAALAGGIFYAPHAMLTIAALYLVTGSVEQSSAEAATEPAETGATSSRSGLSSRLTLLLFVLLMAISGIPPFLGFWPKLLMLQGFIANGDWLLAFTLLLNSLLTLLFAARLWSLRVWRPAASADSPQPIGAAVLLTGAVLLLGLSPNLLAHASTVAASQLLDPAPYIAAVGLSP